MRLVHPSPIKALFAGLFDDAALFPPANASMQDAVAGHGEHAKAWYAALVGFFVCPAARLGELDAAAQHARFGDVSITLTVPDGVAAVADARAAAAEYGWLHVKAIEVPSRASELETAIATLVKQRPATIFVEVPIAEVTSDVVAALHESRLGLKLRTGGTSEPAFPSSVDLAAALAYACAAGLRVKCTAGLHNAIRHTDTETGFSHHGFLNVLWAIQLLQSGRDRAAAEAALACTDSDGVAAAVRALSSEQVAQLRAQFASIGSCSIAEPLADLAGLGLVPPR